MSNTTGRIWFYAGKAKVRPQIAYGQPSCKSYVPIGWGEYVVFKDKSGTMRFITNVTCETTPQAALEIGRGNPPN